MTASIAHLSDPHITTGLLGSAPAVGLRTALARALALDPRPDAVVITGDLVNHGRPDEYAALRELIGRFPLPVHLVCGNHDDPDALVAEFGGTPFLGGGKQADYAVAHGGFRLVVLKSTVPGEPHGEVDAEQLDWLEATLAEDEVTPTFVCVHHPPIPVGVPIADSMGLKAAGTLAEVLVRHANVVRVLSGHVHRTITGAFAGTVVTVAPSTWLQVDLTRNDGVFAYAQEPTSFLLHVETDGAWATHSVQVSHAAPPLAGF